VSPIDPSTLDTESPRTLDGRVYPDHLRAYEQLDDTLLPALADRAPATFDDLSLAIEEARVRSALPRWLASAEWRGLVERVHPSMTAPRTYVLASRGVDHMRRAA
jgi:hypothetical protein